MPNEKPKAPLKLPDGQLTVAGLRRLLKSIDPALSVIVEGCDCYGDAKGVEVEGSACIITRSN